MEVLKALVLGGSVCGCADVGIILLIVEMAVVVAAGGDPQLHQRCGIHIVHSPACTGQSVVACASHIQEHRELLGVDGAVHAQNFFPYVLHILCDSSMGAVVVDGVADCREACAVRISGLGHQLLGLLTVGLVGGVIPEFVSGIIIILAVLVVEASGKEGICGKLASLGNHIGHIVAVNGQSQSAAHLGILQLGNHPLALGIYQNIVGSGNRSHLERAGLFQAVQLLGGEAGSVG